MYTYTTPRVLQSCRWWMGQKVEVDGISNWKNWSRMCGDGEVLRQSTSFCDIRKFESFATLLSHIFRKVHRHCERGVLGPNQIEIAGDSTIQRVHMISEKQWKLFLQRTSQGCFLFGDFYLIRFGTLPGKAYQILGSWLNDNPVDPTLFSQDSINSAAVPATIQAQKSTARHRSLAQLVLAEVIDAIPRRDLQRDLCRCALCVLQFVLDFQDGKTQRSEMVGKTTILGQMVRW